MTHTEIREAILTNGWQGKSPGEIAALLNVPQTVLVERMIGVGTVLDALGPANGAALLDQVKAVAETDAVVKYGWMLLESASLDVGLDSTRGMLDALLPAEAATVLKGLAEQTVTAGVTVQQVIDAMEGI
ncbi:MAG: hypothetical protein RBR35_17560 [Salinivirgaceae bacterium]|nr:hypothetical protein [Salinivirgaceae bacterium]